MTLDVRVVAEIWLGHPQVYVGYEAIEVVLSHPSTAQIVGYEAVEVILSQPSTGQIVGYEALELITGTPVSELRADTVPFTEDYPITNT